MAHQVKTCVHCGFCLPVCPTYKDLGQEMDSPRGRIILMKEMLEGSLDIEEGLPYVDKCLGCMACVTACPSGVEYGELLTPFRALARDRVTGTLLDRLTRLSFRLLLPFPRRFRAAAALGRLVRPFTGMLPARMASMLELLPRTLPSSSAPSVCLPRPGAPPRPRRSVVGLRAAGAGSRDQLGHLTGSGSKRSRGHGAGRTGVLRRFGATQWRHRSGPASGGPQFRRLTCRRRRHRHQRRRLRFRDQGVPPPVSGRWPGGEGAAFCGPCPAT